MSSPEMAAAPPTPPKKPQIFKNVERWGSEGRGKSKLGAFVVELGAMVRENPDLKSGFDNEDLKKHMNEPGDPELPPTAGSTFLPWGWKGLVPTPGEDGKVKFVNEGNAKKGTFTGVCPLTRLGPMRYAFTDEAWDAIKPVVESLAQKPEKRKAHKMQVRETLQAKRKRKNRQLELGE